MQKLLRIEAYPGGAIRRTGAVTMWQQGLHLLHRLGATVNAWAERHATRQALAELEEHRLADIGKTAAQARQEAAKPFWRA
jgi:uncharacterized protein YjiS (DUF1127 family)